MDEELRDPYSVFLRVILVEELVIWRVVLIEEQRRALAFGVSYGATVTSTSGESEFK